MMSVNRHPLFNQKLFIPMNTANWLTAIGSKKMDLFKNAEVIQLGQLNAIVGGSETHDQGDSAHHDQGNSAHHDQGNSAHHDQGTSFHHDLGSSDHSDASN